MKYCIATLIAIFANLCNGQNYLRQNTIDFCDYYDRLGIYKEECAYRYIEPETTTTGPLFKQCTLKFLFTTCKYNDYCDSKQLCVQMTGEPCCAPPAHQCPTIEQLGVKCISPNPTNWCYSDKDCMKGKKCCPTGCGYNICSSSGFYGLVRL